ncbi:MAG TPA: hypothetical protein VF406_00010 [Thermodesulfobacteriota bacterium]
MRRNADALTRFFHGVTREAYGELGIRDETLAGYVADLLVRFARTDGLYRLRDPGGRRIDTIVEMLLEIGRLEPGVASHPEREREIRRHIGDYALFMSGLFPEYVARRGGLDYFHEQGRRAYRSVFEHDRARYRPGAVLFGALAADFPRHAGALTYMRQVHFPRHAHGEVGLALRDLLS